MLRALVATVTAGALVGCGASWPERAAAVTNPAFRQAPNVTTIDILPMDLQVWTEDGYPRTAEDIRSDAAADLTNATIDALTQHHYAIATLIDPAGESDGTAVMAKADVDATMASLARYGETAAAHPGQLPYPFLPARLGVATGADATLYIGGWGFVASHHESTGEKVAEGIAIGLVVIGAIVLIAAAASALDDHHKGSKHESHEAGNVRDHRSGSHSSSFGNAAVHVANETGEGAAHIALRVAADTTVRLVDAFGREAVIDPSHPDWEQNAPHDGDPQLYLEMTLVHNATGYVLWHAHQTFPANAVSHGDLERAARTMIATLPSHG